MDAARWDRTAFLAGVGAPLLWFAGVAVSESGGMIEGAVDPAAALSHIQDNNAKILLGGVLFIVGSLLFLWFLGALRAFAAQREGRAMRLTGTLFATGIAFAGFISATWGPQMSAALYLEEESSASLSPEAAQAMWLGGDGYFVIADLMLAGFLLAVTILTFSIGLLPRWLGWIAALMTLVLLVPPIGWIAMIFVFPIWLLIASVVLYRTVPASDTV
jgi:hypothetical protein